MSESQNSTQAEVNKAFLYGRYEAGEERNRRRQDWKDRLWRKVTNKSLDIADEPDDPMNVTVKKTGLTWREILAVGAVGASLLGAGKLLFDWPKAAPAASYIDADTDTDTLTDLEFVEPAKE